MLSQTRKQKQARKPAYHYYGTVATIPAYGDSLQFYSDSQDVDSINQLFNIDPEEFNAYFCEIDLYTGDIIRLWGIEGIIPRIDKPCWLIC